MQQGWSTLAYERIKRGDKKTLMTTGSSKPEKGQAEGAAERSSLSLRDGHNSQAEVARYSRVDKIW